MTTKFQKKIFRSLALIMVIFLAGLIFIFSLDSYEQMAASRKNNLLVLSGKTADAFASLIQDMDAIALHLTSNASIREIFYQAYKEEYSNTQIYDAIKDDFVFLLVPVDTSRFRISLYNESGNFISAGMPYSNDKIREFLPTEEYRQYYNSITIPRTKQLSGFQPDPWSNSQAQYLSLYRELGASTNMKKRVALVEIQCADTTVDSILSLVQSDTSTLLLDDAGGLVYASAAAGQSQEELLLAYGENPAALEGTIFEDTKNLVTAEALTNGWHLICIQSLHSPLQLMENYILLTIIIAAVCLSGALLVVFLVIKYNTKPLLALTDSIKELSLSSPYLDIDQNSFSDELVHLTDAFNQMMNKLTISMEENTRARECEMRANLIALQSQMDPHFLYNMLSVIDSYDTEEDFDNIHQICIYMSSMLRYISSYLENTADLEMELTHTSYYLQLMKFRFEDQFHYEITVEPGMDLKRITVPKLILQPILENCFQHGFKKVLPPWHVKIAFTRHCVRGWCVDICDNGCGFTEEAKEALAEKLNTFGQSPSDTIASLQIGGMGLMNTLVRIRYFLKDSFTYEIISPPEGGACIRIGGLQYDEHHSDRG